MINRFFAWLNVFSRNEDGVTSIEYGIIAALLSGVLIVGFQSVGTGISNPMVQLTIALNTGGASTGSDVEDSGGSDDSGESDDSDVSENEDDNESGDDSGVS